MRLLIPVAAGMEGSVRRQLRFLGFAQKPQSNENGRIEVEGDIFDVARLNVFLRSGERVLIALSSFQATTFDELFAGVYAIPWEKYLCRDSKIIMDGKSNFSTLGAIKAAGGVAKKAIIRRLADKLTSNGGTRRGGTEIFAETGARTIVGVSLYKDVATITMDTSGEGLHKRGYRSLPYDAPLKETLAAGIIDLTYYHGDMEKPFADPFCGSGTLPIEAALSMRNIAPGKNRTFDFQAWNGCGEYSFAEIAAALKRAKEEATDTEKRGGKLHIYASDISPKAISIAKYHAQRAGVLNDIQFSVLPAEQFSCGEKYGVLACNPPYGERLSSKAEVEKTYHDFSKAFFSLPSWSGYILTAYPGFERAFSRRADMVKRLSNANLPCGLYCYFGEKPKK